MMLPWSTNNDLTDEQFFNRTDKLNLITNILKTTELGSSPDLFLIGVRGVGKKTLMRKILHGFEKEYLVIRVDISKSTVCSGNIITRQSFMELFYNQTIKACLEHDLDMFSNKIGELLEINGILADNSVKGDDMPIPQLCNDNNYPEVSEFVMDLPQKIYEEYSSTLKGVIVVIDEIHKIKNLNEDLNGFLWYLRSCIQDQGNVAYVLSGSMSILDQLVEAVAGNTGAFGGRILTILLDEFSYEDTKKYLNQKAFYLDFTEEGLKKFYECTRGLPSYINTFGNLITHDELLTPDVVENELKLHLNVLLMPLINLWYTLTHQEQEIMVKLVEKPLIRKELADELNVTIGSISKPLIKLQNLLLLDKDEYKYKIYDNLFQLWLREYFIENGVYPYHPV